MKNQTSHLLAKIDFGMPQLIPRLSSVNPNTACFSTLESLYFHFLNPNTSSSFTTGLSLDQLTTPPSFIPAMLFTLTALRLVVTTSAGIDHIDNLECCHRGIHAAGAGKLFSDEVADMAVSLLIDVMSRISMADRFVRTRCNSGP